MSEWVLEVSEVNEYVRQLLQNEPALRKVRLRGEISNFKRHSSGHWYFTLKDERCRIAAVMFRQNAMRMSIRPMDGMSVIVSGQVGLYSEGGSYQITCDSMRPDGIGTLYQQFEALKNRLAAEGLFDEEHKRRLPYRPKKIAVVTSETGAVLHDICMVSRARDPGVPLVLVPVQVQGAGAAESIAQGIRRAAKIPEVEVVIVGRGGGSMEDLWAFNEEIVARAIYDCPIPVISAVGHETDFMIADFVADRRAATPSNAAEMAVPDLREILAGLDGMRQHLQTALSQHLQETRLALMMLEKRLAACDPNQRLTALEKRLGGAKMRLEHQMSQRISALTPRLGMARIRLDGAAEQNLQRKTERLHRQKLHLQALNPEAVLERGYALVLDGGRVLPDREAARTHPQMTIRFRDGEMRVMQPNKEGAYGSEKEADV